MFESLSTVQEVLVIPGVRAGLILLGSLLVAYISEFIVRKILLGFTRKTKTEIDDKIVEAMRRPIFLSVIFIGAAWAIQLEGPPGSQRWARAALETLAILVWARAAFDIGQFGLEALSIRRAGKSIVQPRTLPVFHMLVKITVFALAVYFAFLAWNINLTAWMASAGILGLAIGFAAKDTLANLFAGIFIVADAPYKVGDFIVLDENTQLRGMVTKIGLRSTRILTKDDVEITIPNAVIGSSKIINEAGGPNTKQRVKVPVGVAYGSDVDKVRKVLLECPEGVDQICDYPKPQVRFKSFGASSLDVELQFWIAEPGTREAVVDQMHVRVYKAFAKADIEIPFQQVDMRIKEMPKR